MVWHFTKAIKDLISGLHIFFSQDRPTNQDPRVIPNQQARERTHRLEGFMSEGSDTFVHAMREQLNNQNLLVLNGIDQSVLNRICTKCDSAISDIFREYMIMNDTLFRALMECQGTTDQVLHNFRSTYSLGTMQHMNHQLLLGLGNMFSRFYRDDFLRNQIEHLRTTNETFQNQFDFVEKCLAEYKQIATQTYSKRLPITAYRQLFSSYFKEFFLRNKVSFNSLEICWQFNEEATIAIIVGAYMKLVDSANDDIICTASSGYWKYYKGSAISDLPNDNSTADYGSTYEVAANAFSHLIQVMVAQFPALDEALGQSAAAPAAHSQEMADIMDECYTALEWVQTAWCQLDGEYANQIQLEVPGRVFKRLAAYNQVFSINRPGNNVGFFTDSEQTFQMSHAYNNTNGIGVQPVPIPDNAEPLTLGVTNLVMLANIAQQQLNNNINVTNNNNNGMWPSNNEFNEMNEMFSKNTRIALRNKGNKLKIVSKAKLSQKLKAVKRGFIANAKKSLLAIKEYDTVMKNMIKKVKKRKIKNIFGKHKFIVHKRRRQRIRFTINKYMLLKVKKIVLPKLNKRGLSRKRSNLTKKSVNSNVAIKPRSTTVGRPRSLTVSKPRSTTVGRPRSLTVSKPRSTTVGRPRSLTVSKPRSTTVGRPRSKTPRSLTLSKPRSSTGGRPRSKTPNGLTPKSILDILNAKPNARRKLVF